MSQSELTPLTILKEEHNSKIERDRRARALRKDGWFVKVITTSTGEETVFELEALKDMP